MYNISSEDTFIWGETALVMHLYDCLTNDLDIDLSLNLEGICLARNGIYRILDNFCKHNNYDPRRITIYTANMLESHDRFNIVKVPEDWYEVEQIQTWLQDRQLPITNTPSKHFGNFIGRSTWSRLWIASILNAKYKDKTFQTFNSGLQSNYIRKEGAYDSIGLDDLVSHECDILGEVVEFLKTCPRVIPEDVDYIKTLDSYITQHSAGDIYPIQHPANLNILKEYNDIFVDVICETRMVGDIFFVTEKTWRCIVAKRPFIVVGNANFLSNLKKLGFKTFSNYWDEGYDYTSIQFRIKHIEQVLATISNWSTQELHHYLEDMQDILEHNYRTFLQLDYQTIKRTFE
jgi:hypothetical protein